MAAFPISDLLKKASTSVGNSQEQAASGGAFKSVMASFGNIANQLNRTRLISNMSRTYRANAAKSASDRKARAEGRASRSLALDVNPNANRTYVAMAKAVDDLQKKFDNSKLIKVLQDTAKTAKATAKRADSSLSKTAFGQAAKSTAKDDLKSFGKTLFSPDGELLFGDFFQNLSSIKREQAMQAEMEEAAKPLNPPEAEELPTSTSDALEEPLNRIADAVSQSSEVQEASVEAPAPVEVQAEAPEAPVEAADVREEATAVETPEAELPELLQEETPQVRVSVEAPVSAAEVPPSAAEGLLEGETSSPIADIDLDKLMAAFENPEEALMDATVESVASGNTDEFGNAVPGSILEAAQVEAPSTEETPQEVPTATVTPQGSPEESPADKGAEAAGNLMDAAASGAASGGPQGAAIAIAVTLIAESLKALVNTFDVLGNFVAAFQEMSVAIPAAIMTLVFELVAGLMRMGAAICNTLRVTDSGLDKARDKYDIDKSAEKYAQMNESNVAAYKAAATTSTSLASRYSTGMATGVEVKDMGTLNGATTSIDMEYDKADRSHMSGINAAGEQVAWEGAPSPALVDAWAKAFPRQNSSEAPGVGVLPMGSPSLTGILI